MTVVTIPNRPKPSENRDINAILANFDAITTVVNGQLESDNIKDGSLKGVDLQTGTVTEDRLSPAVQTLLNKAQTGLVYKQHGSNFTAVSGELVETVTGCTEVKLPAPTVGATIGIIVGEAGPVTVKTTAGSIFGDFITGVTSVKLALYQHLLLQANGGNWFITAGEPKREQTYSAEKTYSVAEAEAGVEVSATRPAMVTLTWRLLSNGTIRAFVGAVKICESQETNKFTTTFYLPPGVKWKAQMGSGEVAESHILL